MASDYSVVIRVRQGFGDKKDANETTFEFSVPFVGASKDFAFNCENIDRSKEAVLQFQSYGVSHRSNIIRVNGFNIPGGIPTSFDFSMINAQIPVVRGEWKTNTLIISPNILQENNLLYIESRNIDGSSNADLDNFIIDNAVVFFKELKSISNGPTLPTRNI